MKIWWCEEHNSNCLIGAPGPPLLPCESQLPDGSAEWCRPVEKLLVPADSLVIEPSDVESVQSTAQWLFDHGFEEHDCATYTETQLVLRASDNARLKCEWVLPNA